MISATGERTLRSWKEIAGALGRDVRTVRRWEARGLPVHRVPGQAGRATIFAYRSELARWSQDFGAGSEDGQARPEAAAPTVDADQTGFGGTAPERPLTFRSDNWRASAPVIVGLVCTIALVGGMWSGARRLATGPAPIRLTVPIDRVTADLYATAVVDWEKRTAPSLRQALAGFERVVSRHPEFAPGHLGVADTYLLLREYGGIPDELAYLYAKRAADRAIALDDHLAGAHRALAFVEANGLQEPEAAEREFQRALELDPRSALTHHWHATSLLDVGDLKGARREVEQALRLDPTSLAILIDATFIRGLDGEMADAIGVLEHLAKLNPELASIHNELSQLYLAQGEADRSAREMLASATLTGDPIRREAAEAGLAARSRGNAAQFEAMLVVRLRQHESGQPGAFDAARYAAALGRPDEALRYLSAAAAAHEGLGFAPAVPEFSAIRNRPEFRTIVESAGPA